VPSGPTIEQLGDDPPPVLARLRADAPVVFVPALGGYLVVGREAALTVLHDPVTFTVDDLRFSTARVVGTSMLSTDGDEHARHRSPFTAPFRPRQVTSSLAGTVAEVVARHVGALAARPERRGELRSAVAGPVAATVVGATLGLDAEVSADRLLGWYRDIGRSVAGITEGRSPTGAGAASMGELAAAVEHALGGPSLLGDAVAGGALDRSEVVSNAAVIMFGGIETTEAMILNAVWFVLRAGGRPDPDDAAAVAAAVEESLRLEPAAAVVDRYATVDTVVGGVAIPARSLVTVSLTAANRDPAEFPEPDRFDPRRANLRRQLAFAAGPHVCLGLDLARLEAATTLAALLRGLPGLRLADGSPGPTGLVFRKPVRLDVTW
jgi:cytochrome P450